MTSEDISINSDNLKVDKNGNITLYSEVRGAGDGSTSLTMQTRNTDNIAKLFPNLLHFRKSDSSCYIGNLGWPAIFMKNYNNTNQIAMQISDTLGASIRLGDDNNNAIVAINLEGITTPTLTQTSLAEQKKNFEKMQDNAIEIIKNIDIYKYNLKSEKDTDKKHMGFVIGDEYNYSKEVTSLDNKGVDNYSFTSLCCKAIQEQQELIEQLQKEIKQLKGEN